MLRIERQDARADGPRPRHHGCSGADQALLVGERDRPAGRQRGEGGFQTGRAGDRADDDVAWHRHGVEHSVPACPAGDAAAGQGLSQRRVPHRHRRARRKRPRSRSRRAASAFASRPPTTAPIARRPGFSATTSHVERPMEPVAPRSVTVRRMDRSEIEMDEEQGEPGKDQHGPVAVEAVQEPAMAGDQAARNPWRRNGVSAPIRRGRRPGWRPRPRANRRSRALARRSAPPQASAAQTA